MGATNPFNWQQAAAQAGSDVANGILGIVAGNINDKRQLKQQSKLQDLQMKGSKQMMDYQQQLALQMWKDTSYSAQKEQMQKAGINPALMYGMGGGGGQTIGNATASVTGGQAPSGGGELSGVLGLQRNLIAAQIRNVDANTNKTNVEAGKIGGVDTKEALQRIDLMAQQQDNERWRNELLQLDWALKQMDKYAGNETLEERVAKFKAEAGQAIAEMKSKMVQANVDEKTQATKIEQAKASLAFTYMQSALAKSNIQVNDQQIVSMINKVAQDWQSLRIDEQEMYIKRYMAEVGMKALPALAMTDIVKTLGGIFSAGELLKTTPEARRTVEGFGRGNKQ